MKHLKKQDYEILASFRYSLRKFLCFSEKACLSAGLTPHQYQTLLALKGLSEDSITIGELADHLQVKHHSAVELVDRLILLNLVARKPSQEDHRRVLVKITRKGSRILKRLALIHRKELKNVSPRLILLLKKLR